MNNLMFDRRVHRFANGITRHSRERHAEPREYLLAVTRKIRHQICIQITITMVLILIYLMTRFHGERPRLPFPMASIYVCSGCHWYLQSSKHFGSEWHWDICISVSQPVEYKGYTHFCILVHMSFGPWHQRYWKKNKVDKTSRKRSGIRR